jgi:hypothetical protein
MAYPNAAELTVVNGFGQSTFNRPAKLVDSRSEYADIDMHFISPISQYHCPAPKADQLRAASVSGLLPLGGPVAITWFVVALVVLTLYRMSASRFGAHVGKEVFERISPTITHGNTSTAVTVEVFESRVVAPTLDFLPSSPLRRIAHQVPTVRFRQSLISQTAATFNAALKQIVRAYRYRLSAFATEMPFACTDISQDGKPSEYLASNVTKPSGFWNGLENDVRFGVGHGVFSCTENFVVRLVRVVQTSVRAIFILPRFVA